MAFEQYLSRRMMSPTGWTYFCRQCGTYLPESEFYKKKDTHWGVDTSCKNHGQNIKGEYDPEMEYLKLNPLTEEDFYHTQEALKKMGYCFNCNKTVHEQFMEKYKTFF